MKLDNDFAADYDDTPRGRRSRRIPTQGKPVALHDTMHGVIVGETLDEAFGGLGVVMNSRPDLQSGQEADVFYNGMRMTAIVRHIGPHGSESDRFYLGLAWKGAVLSQQARSALRTRKERGLESDDPRYERFIRSIPGGVHTMWSLYESENWLEMCDSAERIAKQGRAADVDDLTPFVDRLKRFVGTRESGTGESFETVGNALHELIETAIGICNSLDW